MLEVGILLGKSILLGFGQGDLEGWRRIFGSSRRHYFRARVLLSSRYRLGERKREREGQVRLDFSVPLTPIPIIVKWGKESYRGNSVHTNPHTRTHLVYLMRDALRINRKNYTQRRPTWNGTISFTGGGVDFPTRQASESFGSASTLPFEVSTKSRSSLRASFALNNWYVYYYVVAKTRSFVRLLQF